MRERSAARARAVVLQPSIDDGPAFAVLLRQVVEHGLPPGMTCTIVADIQAGVVEAVRVPGRHLARVAFDNWSGDLRSWLQMRTPSDWWGALTVRVQAGRLSHVAIRRILVVGES